MHENGTSDGAGVEAQSSPDVKRSPGDYWGAVSGALSIAGRYRFLWFFGFFAASGGGGGAGTNWSEDAAPWAQNYFMERPEVLILIVLALVVVGLAFFVMGIISRGALIGSVGLAVSGSRPSFSEAWSLGLRYALPLFGLVVLAILAALLVTAICAISVLLPIAAGAPGIAIAVVIGVVLFFPYLAFLIALALTVTYAERAIVLENAPFLDAISAGWSLVRSRVGESLVYWLIGLLAGLIFTVGIVFILVVVGAPVFILGTQDLVAALAVGIPVGFVIMALANGVFGTYFYSYWTLAYLNLRAEGPA